MTRPRPHAKARQKGQRKKTGHRGSPGRGRIIAFGTLTVVVLAAAAFFLWPAFRSSTSATPGAIPVQLSMGGFDPSRVEARVGETVTLRLVNRDNGFHTDGGGWHQLASDELGIDWKVGPLKTQEFTFTPTKSGTFQFYCDICCGGRENPYMQGTLEVRS
ncbi:MAG: cupredoxin domain-containing protein [Chloroflexi bacterium]|nr:cupredoxin domain-containing protein [Chloroflexota bacterium]